MTIVAFVLGFICGLAFSQTNTAKHFTPAIKATVNYVKKFFD